MALGKGLSSALNLYSSSGGGGASNSGPWASFDEMVDPATAGQGGHFVSSIGGQVTTTAGMSPYHEALNNYLQGASGLNQNAYNRALSAGSPYRAAANSAYNAARSAANQNYGLTVRGINEDLLFGNQLRGQERYRNVDLGRARSRNEFTSARNIHGITKADLLKRYSFNDRGFGLANQSTRMTYDRGMRATNSDAIARGARTAQGTLDQFGDVRDDRNLGLSQNRLQYDTTKNQLVTESKFSDEAYRKAKKVYGIDQKTFDSLAKTYGIQAAQAAAQAALGRDRAAATRDQGIASARAQRQSAYAGASQAQSAALDSWGQQQMALMQALYSA